MREAKDIIINGATLEKTLKDHAKFLSTDGREGRAADLTGVDLHEASLSGADLRKVILVEADLERPNPMQDRKISRALLIPVFLNLGFVLRVA
jgi:uncharacterized protein YjbI with pentapeptide repeats